MSGKANFVFIFLFVVAVSFESFSQYKLFLIKKNAVVARFEEGEFIRFQWKNSKHFSSGVITGIHRDFFKVGNDDTIYVHQIRKIDLRNHSSTNFHTAASGVLLMAAGAGLFILDLVQLNPNHDVHPGIVTVSCAFVGVGLIAQFVNNNFFKVGRRKKIAILKT